LLSPKIFKTKPNLASERADSGTHPVLHHDRAIFLENDQLRAVFSFVLVIWLPLHPEGM